MNKVLKRSLMTIFIVIIIIAIAWLVYDVIRSKPVDANTSDSNLADQNTGLDNVINELFDNVVVDDIEQNIIQNTVTNSNTESEINNTLEEKENTEVSNGSVTSREEKAIQLVKKEWGSTDGVHFSNMGIDSQGRYIISVNDATTTRTLAFFTVDVDREIITKQ